MATAEVLIGDNRATLTGSEADNYFAGLQGTGIVQDPVVEGILPFLTPSSVCLDIGANIGVYSVGIAPALPSGHVVAVEPAPETYRYLCENLARAGVSHTALQSACGAASGTTSLSFTAYFAAGSHLAAPTDDPSDTGATIIEVPLATVDQIVSTSELKRVDVIKVDVEGYELSVLAGAARTLRQFEPIVQLEFNHFAFTQHVRQLPQDVLEAVRSIFPFIYVHSRSDGRLARLATSADEYRLLWANGVTGPVDNLLCAFHELLPQAPNYDSVWQSFVSGPPSIASPSTLQHEIDAIHATVSWRLTRPLRAVRRRSR